MDPNVCLRDARELLELASKASTIASHDDYRLMALDRYFDLDQWLSKGGLLPDDWSK